MTSELHGNIAGWFTLFLLLTSGMLTMQALTERCNSLNRSLKSLEEQLSAKTGELIQMQDK